MNRIDQGGALGSWMVAAGYADSVAAPGQPKITLGDRGAEGNRAQRRAFFDALTCQSCVSSDFADFLASELGIDGDVDISSKPLEARQICQLIDQTKMHVVSEKLESVSAGVSVTRRLLEEAFDAGVDLEIADVCRELAAVVPPAGFPEALKAALDCYRAEMAAHLREAARIVKVAYRELPDGKVTEETKRQAVGEVRAYARACLDDFREAVSDPARLLSHDFPVVKARAFFNVLASVVQVVEAVVRLRTALCLLRIQADVAARKAALEAVKERLEALKAKLEALLKALLERLEAKDEAAEDDANVKALIREAESEAQLALAEESAEEIRRLVEGFDRRIAETRADVREAVTGHKWVTDN